MRETTNIDQGTTRQIDRQAPVLFTCHGIVLKDTVDRLALASHVSNEKPSPTYRKAQKIPWSVDRSIKVLEVSPER